VIYILGKNITIRKHLPVLMTLLLGLSIPLMGCSGSSAGLTKSTPTTAVATPTNTTATPTNTTATPPDTTANSSDTTTSNTPIDSNINTSATGQKVSQSGKTTTSTKTSSKGNADLINKLSYSQLQYGYTYEKIQGLFGDTGEVVTESGTKGNKGYTVTYIYHVKSPAVGEMFLAFKDDKLVNKMQVNLQ